MDETGGGQNSEGGDGGDLGGSTSVNYQDETAEQKKKRLAKEAAAIGQYINGTPGVGSEIGGYDKKRASGTTSDTGKGITTGLGMGGGGGDGNYGTGGTSGMKDLNWDNTGADVRPSPGGGGSTLPGTHTTMQYLGGGGSVGGGGPQTVRGGVPGGIWNDSPMSRPENQNMFSNALLQLLIPRYVQPSYRNQINPYSTAMGNASPARNYLDQLLNSRRG